MEAHGTDFGQWFLESYRILPTCEAITETQDVRALADKTIYTLEDTLGFDDLTDLSAELLEVKILKKLDSMFTQRLERKVKDDPAKLENEK